MPRASLAARIFILSISLLILAGCSRQSPVSRITSNSSSNDVPLAPSGNVVVSATATPVPGAADIVWPTPQSSQLDALVNGGSTYPQPVSAEGVISQHTIAFVANAIAAQPDVYILPQFGSLIRLTTDGKAWQVSGLQWSPDGSHLLYEDNGNLYVSDAKGATVVPVLQSAKVYAYGWGSDSASVFALLTPQPSGPGAKATATTIATQDQSWTSGGSLGIPAQFWSIPATGGSPTFLGFVSFDSSACPTAWSPLALGQGALDTFVHPIAWDSSANVGWTPAGCYGVVAALQGRSVQLDAAKYNIILDTTGQNKAFLSAGSAASLGPPTMLAVGSASEALESTPVYATAPAGDAIYDAVFSPHPQSVNPQATWAVYFVVAPAAPDGEGASGYVYRIDSTDTVPVKLFGVAATIGQLSVSADGSMLAFVAIDSDARVPTAQVMTCDTTGDKLTPMLANAGMPVFQP